MSYRCNNCLYIFSSKHNNCPFCGGRIFENEVSDGELISDGFAQAPIPISFNKNIPATTDNIVENYASNIFEELQASYNSEHISDNYSTQGHSTNNNNTHSETHTSSLNANGSSSSSTEGGYFAQFNSNSNSFVHEVELSSTPPIISPPSSDSASAYYDEEYEHEMQRLKKQQRSIQRDYNRLAISNFFRNIQWRNVFRILFILGIIILAIVIWNMRYVIIESITNFLISLIPIIIIIAILWYLIKNLFKY